MPAGADESVVNDDDEGTRVKKPISSKKSKSLENIKKKNMQANQF